MGRLRQRVSEGFPADCLACFGGICHVSPELTQNEEDKANARLIASAPDLLEALEKARDYILSIAAKSADAEHDYADFELLKRVDLVIDRAIGNPAPSNF